MQKFVINILWQQWSLNNEIKNILKDYFNIDIDKFEVDFTQFNAHIPSNVSEDEFENYYFSEYDGITQCIFSQILYLYDIKPYYKDVSNLMEYTAEVMLIESNLEE